MAEQRPRVVATILWAGLLVGSTLFLGVALYVVFGLRGGVGVGVLPTGPGVLGSAVLS